MITIIEISKKNDVGILFMCPDFHIKCATPNYGKAIDSDL